MVTRVGINGFGRIGRLVLRATNSLHPEALEVAAVNDLTDAKTNAHLYKYDTSYGPYEGSVEANNGDLVVDGRSIKVFSERDPAQIPWAEMGVDLVIESTGIFTDAEKARGMDKKVVFEFKDVGEVFSMHVRNQVAVKVAHANQVPYTEGALPYQLRHGALQHDCQVVLQCP